MVALPIGAVASNGNAGRVVSFTAQPEIRSAHSVGASKGTVAALLRQGYGFHGGTPVPVARTHYCGHCGRYVEGIRVHRHAVLHAALTLLTCGLWLPVWAVANWRSAIRCPSCRSDI